MDSVLEILTGARDRIARGWTQHAFARDAAGHSIDSTGNGQACAWCAYGAIADSAGGRDWLDAEVAVLKAAIPLDREYPLADWNDAYGRTQADVLAAFDRAIASLAPPAAGPDPLPEHRNTKTRLDELAEASAALTAPPTRGPKLEIMRTLIVSSAHITETDDATMEAGECPRRVHTPHRGAYREVFVYDNASELKPGGTMSPHFDALVKLARENGCDWLRIDADGPLVAGLPTFEW